MFDFYPGANDTPANGKDMYRFLFCSLKYFIIQTIKSVILLMLFYSGTSLDAQDTTIVKDWKKEVFLRPLSTSKERVFRKVVRDSTLYYFGCRNLDSSIESCYSMHVDLNDSFRVFMHTKRNIISLKIDTLVYRTVCWKCDKVGDGVGLDKDPYWETMYSLFYKGKYLIMFSDRYNAVYIYKLRLYLRQNREQVKVGYKEALSYVLDPEHSFLDCAEYLKIFDVTNIPKNSVLIHDFKRKQTVLH
jgi:hypothetical protein